MRVLAEKQVLASAQEASAAELAAERTLRLDWQNKFETSTEQLGRAVEKIRAQECDLEMMCEDLAGAESTLNITHSALELLQAETATHNRERIAEAEEISRLMDSQVAMEHKVQHLMDALGWHHKLGQNLHKHKEQLQQELQDTIEYVHRLEGELSLVKTRALESEYYLEHIRSGLDASALELSELQVHMFQAHHAAWNQISSLEMECKDRSAQLEKVESELRESQHETSESFMALSRIFRAASKDASWLGDAGLEVVCADLQLHLSVSSTVPDQVSRCVMVNTIVENGAAADNEKLRSGHILLEIGGQCLNNQSESEVREMLEGPVGSRLHLVAQCGLDAERYETVLIRKATDISRIQNVSCQASSVCQFIYSMQEQIRELNQAHERSVFDMSRLVEAEEQRSACTWATLRDCVAAMESIKNDFRSEFACMCLMQSQLEHLTGEHKTMEHNLIHAIHDLADTHDKLTCSTKLVEEAVERSNLQSQYLKSLLDDEKQKAACNEMQLIGAHDELTKLGVKHKMSVGQVEEMKVEVFKQNEERESVQSALTMVRQDLAATQHDLAEYQVLVSQMYRAVCGKFKKTSIGLKLKIVEEHHFSNRVVIVDSVVPGGAADSDGQIQVGDVVKEIDGKEPNRMSGDVLRSMLAGPVGSSVVMTILRNTEKREFEVSLICTVPSKEKQTAAGQAVEVCDCAHSLFIEMQQLCLKCTTMTSALEVQKASATKLQESNDKLQGDLAGRVEDIKQLRKQTEMLEKVLEQEQTASKAKDRNIARMAKEHDSISKKLVDANETCQNLSVQYDESRREWQIDCARLQQSAKDSACAIADLKGCLSTRDSQASLMKLEIERLKGESCRHKVESEAVKKQILILRDTHEELKALLVQSREENSRLLEHFESERCRVEMVESKLTIALAGSQRLDMEKAGVSSNLIELRQKHDDALEHAKHILMQLEQAQQDTQTQRSEISRLEAEKEDLEQAISEAKVSLDLALQEIEELKEEAERGSERLKAELQNAGDIVQEQAEVHAILLKEKSTIEYDLSSVKERNASLECELKATSIEIGRLKTRIVDVESALSSTQIEKDHALDEVLYRDGTIYSFKQDIDNTMSVVCNFLGTEIP